MDDRTLVHLVLGIAVLSLVSNVILLQQVRTSSCLSGGGRTVRQGGGTTAPANAYFPGYFECSDLGYQEIMPKTDKALNTCFNKFDDLMAETDCERRLGSCKAYCTTLQWPTKWVHNPGPVMIDGPELGWVLVENPLYTKCEEWCELNLNTYAAHPCT